MTNRNAAYFNKVKARRILENPLGTDLATFLKATFSLSKSRVVKNHIKQSIQQLESRFYQLSA